MFQSLRPSRYFPSKNNMKNKRFLLLLIAVVAVCAIALYIRVQQISYQAAEKENRLWQVQSVDTMKYSRDLSRDKLGDPTFDLTIHQMMKQIAATGATHVAIGTPYDEEFLPILNRWVRAARENGLHVWFRGNFAGWEGWFGYKKIGRDEHKQKLRTFLNKNSSLFRDGDIFSSCPECENGGPGDPRKTGDVEGHRLFLIDETRIADEIFLGKNLKVAANFHSMNGDVAKVIMDKKTTKALGGIVVVDHYVATPEQLASDIREYGERSGGKIVLGEFGAPILDIHGQMSEQEQADWLNGALSQGVAVEDLVGLNYWVNRGGSTALWGENGRQRLAVSSLTMFYKPIVVAIRVENPLGMKLHATVEYVGRVYTADKSGTLYLPLLSQTDMSIQAKGYFDAKTQLTVDKNNTIIVLKPQKKDIWYYVLYLLSLPLSFLRFAPQFAL